MRTTCLYALLILCTVNVLSLSAGELSVGKKVVYPGGADQPPKEKDVGVKLKVTPVSATIGSTGESEECDEQPDFEALFAEGNTREILNKTAGKKDPSSQAYRALALDKVDRKKEALETAQKALKSEDLPEDLRERLQKIVEAAKPDTAKESQESPQP